MFAPQGHRRVGDAASPAEIDGINVVEGQTLVLVTRIDPVRIATARSYEDTPEKREENSSTENIRRRVKTNRIKARVAALSHHSFYLLETMDEKVRRFESAFS